MPGSDADGRVKAELIAAGAVSVPRRLLSGYRLSRSTAGPGAGSASVALEWEGGDGRPHRIKLAVVPEGGAPLEVVPAPDGELELRRPDGAVVLRRVRLLPILMHAPDHAFINLDGECRHECAFCTVHAMDPRRRNLRTPQRWVELIVEAHRRRPFDGLAITSVALQDHEELMRIYETIVEGVLQRLPDLVVGVEPYAGSIEDVRRLRAAGASEIKINIQSPVRDILARICPGWDLDRQYALLEEAVRVFGRGKVTTNVLVGLGETDEDLAAATERLTAMGVVPSLRVVRVGDLNRQNLEGALGHPLAPVEPERNVRLARMLGEALDRQGLSVDSFTTMCHRCGCCDLEPGHDV